MKSNNQRLAEAMAKTWTFTGQDKNELRRLKTEVESDLGQVDPNLLDVYNAKSSPQEVYEKIRELAPPNDDDNGDERAGDGAPPHSGRPFSTFRAPAARRILCAYGTQYYYGRGSGPWVCVLLGSELTSLISQLFWDRV